MHSLYVVSEERNDVRLISHYCKEHDVDHNCCKDITDFGEKSFLKCSTYQLNNATNYLKVCHSHCEWKCGSEGTVSYYYEEPKWHLLKVLAYYDKKLSVFKFSVFNHRIVYLHCIVRWCNICLRGVLILLKLNVIGIGWFFIFIFSAFFLFFLPVPIYCLRLSICGCRCITIFAIESFIPHSFHNIHDPIKNILNEDGPE